MSANTLTYALKPYPVSDRNSTVLGYGALSRYGARLWRELDWRAAYKDGGVHILNPCGGAYLHVRCRWSRDMDGPSKRLKDRRWYRVRCRHAIGRKFRGLVIKSVDVALKNGRWFWLLSATRKTHSRKPLTDNNEK